MDELFTIWATETGRTPTPYEQTPKAAAFKEWQEDIAKLLPFMEPRKVRWAGLYATFLEGWSAEDVAAYFTFMQTLADSGEPDDVSVLRSLTDG